MTRACFSTASSLLLAGAVLVAQPAQALFHLAHIAEVNARAGDDPGDQYVEIVMEAPSQTFTTRSVLGAFDCGGTYLGDLLVVPGDLANGGTGVRWIMATRGSTGGIVPDFTIPNGAPAIPGDCGQVCWGAPGLIPPLDPNSWSRTDLTNFVDCVSWGPYTGPTRTGSGAPSPFTPGDGTYSLERVNDTTLTPACPSPENNAGTVGSYGFCPEPTTTSTLFGTSTSTTLFGTSTTTTTIPPTTEERLAGGLQLSTKGKTGTKQKLKLVSIESLGDEVTLGGGPGSADDPTLHGGSLSVFSSVAGAFVNTYPLTSATGTWAPKSKKGQQVGWVFKGDGPITNVTIIESKHVTAKGKGADLGLQLAVDPRPVGVLVDIGAHRYCFQFENPVSFKANKRFRAAKNPAPEVCPTPPD